MVETKEEKSELHNRGWETRRREGKPHSPKALAGYERIARKLRTLSDEEVREIRRRLSEGETQHALSLEFGISQPGISSIHIRKTYRSVV